jgi:hypothetical protein
VAGWPGDFGGSNFLPLHHLKIFFLYLEWILGRSGTMVVRSGVFKGRSELWVVTDQEREGPLLCRVFSDQEDKQANNIPGSVGERSFLVANQANRVPIYPLVDRRNLFFPRETKSAPKLMLPATKVVPKPIKFNKKPTKTPSRE